VITVGAFEAKTHFAQLLSRLQAGEDRIVIQRHGQNVAVLLPWRAGDDGAEGNRGQRLLDGLARIRASAKAGTGHRGIVDLVNEGRRR
jgi:prevent-host-death family protein